jgi:outer membrane usher protein
LKKLLCRIALVPLVAPLGAVAAGHDAADQDPIQAGAGAAAPGQERPALSRPATPPAATPPAGTPTRMTLPVVRNGRIYDDVSVDLYADGQIRYHRESLIERLAPLMSEAGRAQFALRLAERPSVSTDEVASAGIVLRFDSSLLEIHVERVDPLIAPLVRIGSAIEAPSVPITLQPESFSAYLNISADVLLSDLSDLETPALLLTGAVRYDGFVFEFDGGFDSTSGPGSSFYRRAARLIYDQPEQQRRWSAGDIQLSNLGIVGGTLLGGVGVEKGRRNFLGFQPLTPLGGQQVLLERDSTVEVFVAGQQVQTLQLAAGPYDLAQLRAQYSGRNTQLFVTDITGRRQLAEFDGLATTVDLTRGQDEYSAGLGFVPRRFSNQPIYDSSPAFSGYYRRGLTDQLALGGVLQISEDIQVVGAEITAVPRWLPGRFELGAAVSAGDGSGIAVRGVYALQFGAAGDRQVSLAADYRSSAFATLAEELGLPRVRTLNVSANYSQSIGERTFLVAGANLFDRDGLPSARSAYVDVIHRTRHFRLTGGVEYGTGNSANRFGVRVAISVPFGQAARAEAGYNSRRDDFRAFVTRSHDDQVGSWGYDLGIRRTSGSASIDASGTYVGNRFFTRAVLSSGGAGISNIADRQQMRVQIGTAIAYAGGAIAIGRPIQDSFVIASAHPSMTGEQVVIGRSIHERRYGWISGGLGPALGGNLNSYSRQNIVYDLVGGARGFDIGSGIETIEPPYRSGYRLVVGTGATVTAFGFLKIPAGPAGLVAGTITSTDDSEFGSQPFFTNSVGRFAIPGLRPGRTYRVRLNGLGTDYTISVPENGDPLLQLGEILVVPQSDGQE